MDWWTDFPFPKFLFCSRMLTLFLPIHTSFVGSREKYIILLYLSSRMRKSKITYKLIFQITIAPTPQNVVNGCPLRMQAGVGNLSFLMICTWKGSAISSNTEISTQNLERVYKEEERLCYSLRQLCMKIHLRENYHKWLQICKSNNVTEQKSNRMWPIWPQETKLLQ